MSTLEDTLQLQLQLSGLTVGMEREYKFHPSRRWRIDFAWPERMVGVEVEGGVWSGGRHTTGAGYSADCEKYNEAVLLGWRVLRVTGAMIQDGEALEFVTRMMEGDK